MTFRLPSERVRIDIENGPSIEVERVAAWTLAWTALTLVSAFYAAKRPEAEMAALRDVGAFFVAEAQPAWDIADHRGPIPATAAGYLRLPHELGLDMVRGWIETHHEKATAVDATVQPGPARDELNRRLKAARKAA